MDEIDTRRLTVWQVYWKGLPIIARQTFLLCFAIGSWRQAMSGTNKGKLGVFFGLFVIPIQVLRLLIGALLAWGHELLSLLMFLLVLVFAPIWFLAWAWYEKSRVEKNITRKLREALADGPK